MESTDHGDERDTDRPDDVSPGHVYFEIQTDDPDRAIEFYEGVFGWQFDSVDGLPVPYWRIRTGGAAGGLLERPAETPPPECGTNAFVCSFEVANFDETAATIADHGGEIALPKFAVPGQCWQGYFTDTDGNTFGLFEVDETAA